MKYILFLDDLRDFSYIKAQHAKIYEQILLENKNPPIFHAKNYEEFTTIVQEQGLPSFVFYDFDLSDVSYLKAANGLTDVEDKSEKTGLTCCKWLCEQFEKEGKQASGFYTHSQNPVGVSAIKSYIQCFNKHMQNKKNSLTNNKK